MTAPRYKIRTRGDAVGAAKKYGPETWKEWGRQYRGGATMREIAAQYGVAPSTVMRRLHGAGVPGRTRTEQRKLSEAHAVKVTGAGLTEHETAAVAGVSQTTVNRRRRQAAGRGPYPSEVARGR